MKRFLKKILIIALGTMVGGFITIALIISLIIGIQKHTLKPTVSSRLTDKTILRIVLHGRLVEEIHQPLLQVLTKEEPHEIDILTIKNAIRSAQEDRYISGIYLEVGELVAGWATLAELRGALQAFKATGKFIVAYGENYNSKSYYLASLADEIVLHPAGNFIFTGLKLTVLFYKQLLDKLDIAPQIFRVGRYKSAVEPFMQCSMSEASKEQNRVLLDNIYDHLIQTVAIHKNLDPSVLKSMANTLAITQPQEAYKAGLVTQVGYFNDIEALLRAKLKLAVATKINYIDFDTYHKNKQQHTKQHNNRIAVLIASGAIVDKEIGPNYITSSIFVRMLRKLREDPDVKAIVLRINSPGGSALASDTIWKELMLTRACKPIVASMSDIAASGGYYLAAGCDYILAHPTTITGSIGIYGLYFDVHALLKNKLGIVGDVVKTSPSADIFSPVRPFSEHEKNVIQQHIESGYDNFLDKVATGRQMKKVDVARLAEGRVWSGSLAKEHGLVDQLGGLEDAIEKAAVLADLQQSYQVDYWPKSKNIWFKELIMRWCNNQHANLLPSHLTNPYHNIFNYIQELINRRGVQASLPYTIEIE
ncbi:MAG: signal peptide peptidase SppA [Candidatus Amoebophilus sp.]